MTWLARAFRALAVALVGHPPPRVPPGVRRAQDAEQRMPAFIPDTNPFVHDDAASLRQHDVLSLMDEDCYGYLILCVRKEAVGPRARITLAEQLDPSWWPAVARVCEQIVHETRTA